MLAQMVRNIVNGTNGKATRESEMHRYLIEVPHDPTHDECARLAGSLCRAGIHYVTNADWGCADGIHKSWLRVEALSDTDALLIVPPALRQQASIVRLTRFTVEDLEDNRERVFGAGILQAATA